MDLQQMQNPVFVIWAFLFQLLLIAHFALRKLRFSFAVRYGRIVYALGAIGAAVGVQQLLAGERWYFWAGGFLCAVWAAFGFWVEYVRKIAWRKPVVWKVFLPYVGLYLAAIQFSWWPLATLQKAYWYAYAVLFVIGTVLNIASHSPKVKGGGQPVK